MTPSVATSERTSDETPHARVLARARARFTSDSAAAITTAASADCGRSASSELRNSSRIDDEPRADEVR